MSYLTPLTPEQRAEKIARMEAEGRLDPDCPGCAAFYEHPEVMPWAPSHQAMPTCESGGRPHCTCDTCF